MNSSSHLVLLSIFLLVLIIGMLFHKESFVTSINISSDLMSRDYYNSVVQKNAKNFYAPCDVMTQDGVNFRFQAADKQLSWYNVQDYPNTCSVDVSSTELKADTKSCSTDNKIIYDPSVVKEIQWDDNLESGKKCVVVFRKDVTSNKLEEYMKKLPSYKSILSSDTSYISAFNQSLQFLRWTAQKRVEIPAPFHDRFFKQPVDSMARTVCFWSKIWWVNSNWRLLGSVGHGDWWERKPAIYVAPNSDSWLHFTVNNTDTNGSWQDVINSNMRMGFDNCFITCRIYKASDGKYKMTAKITKLSQDASEQVEQQTINIKGKPKLSDLTEIGNRYMLFGNGPSGFTMWDWRVYNRFVTDDELNAIKDHGKTKLSYKSIGGTRVPQYFTLNTHMNRDFQDMIIHPVKDDFFALGNEYFTRQVEKGEVKYICVPSEKDRIYKIRKLQRNVYGYWTFLSLVDIDINGNPTNRSISPNMLYNSHNSDRWQHSFVKMVIGLKELPINFTSKTWLSEIYPNDVS